MHIDKIETSNAPQAIGPYSQAIKCTGVYTDFIFVSGQLPIDPTSNQLVEGDIETLTSRILDNIETILKAAGSNLNGVVKVEIFLKNLERDFAGVNAVCTKRFSASIPPARQTIQVSDLPKGASIEISCIATNQTPQTLTECSEKLSKALTKDELSKNWSDMVNQVRRFFSK